MRIGLIGLGRIGAFHADTLSTIDAIDSLVVTDVRPERVRLVTDRTGAQAVGSVAELLTAGVDGVVIAADTDMHVPLILACVKAGVPTLCEKPVASDGASGAALPRRLAGHDVPVMMGFPRRYDVAMAAVKAAADAGELGRLTTVRSTTMDPEPPSREYIAGSGGIYRDCGVHDFDITRWVTGQEAVEVYATGSDRGAAFFAEVGDVDTATAVITFDGGTLGVVSTTRYNGRGYDVRLEAHGSADSIAAGIDPKWPMRSAGPGATDPDPRPHRFFMDRFADAFRSQFVTFLDVAAGKQPSPCTVADGLEAGWIAEACVRSAAEHRPVRIEEVRIR
jgi:myo-inositol 2-dehydrogenase/D-chiro-inositol 1-dehydrogenase